MTLHLTRDEWDRIAAEGGGVLFRPSVRRPGTDSGSWEMAEHPPAEFVEAAQPCETCEGKGWYWGTKWRIACKAQDCHNGKRRVAVVVPCVIDHSGGGGVAWETVEQTHRTVGHVVVEWGPDPVVKYGEHATVGSYVVVLVEPGSRNAFRVENHRLPVEQHEFTLPPDIDPQSLVGQYACGIKVVEP